MSEANRRALAEAVAVARDAGALLRRAFHQPALPGEPDGKTRADRDAEDLIRARLTAAFPEHGFRAEERPDVNRRGHRADGAFWLVDPNDGTSAFQKGYRGASVSIALIRDRRPVLGVVYAYAAPDDAGDLFAWAEGCGPLQRNGAPVLDPEWPKQLTADETVFVSNSADARALANARGVWPARYQPVPGIAYRLALAAAGDGAAATSLFHPRDFDFAAGHALLRGVGGVLLDERGRPVEYDAEKPTAAGFCFGGSPDVCRALVDVDWPAVVRGPRAEAGPYDLVMPDRDRLTTDAGRLARAQGCWLGHLVGDALGSQVAHRPAGAIDAAWPQGVNALVDRPEHGAIAGQMTDAAELARLLAHTLVERGAPDPDAAARAYRWWFAHHPAAAKARPALRRALSAPDADPPAAALRAAADPRADDPGGLLRAAPLALAGHAWPEPRLVAAARADAALTHGHPHAADAAAALALAMAFALREAPPPDRVYSHAVAGAKALGLAPAVVEALESAGDGRPPPPIQPEGRAPGAILAAVRGAFYQLLVAEDVPNALMDTVARGGDAAPHAAVTGALLGAVHGREALPWIWRDRVLTCRPIEGLPGVGRPRPRALWPVDAMVLAERLLTSS